MSVFDQTLVVATQTDHEQYGRYILEAMDPFSTLGFLTTDVYHKKVMGLQLEDCFRDASAA